MDFTTRSKKARKQKVFGEILEIALRIQAINQAFFCGKKTSNTNLFTVPATINKKGN